jgi:group I intron endonuclease
MQFSEETLMNKDLTKQTGVYLIRNVVNGKLYVGSTQNFKFRWQTHQSLLKRGKHHSWKLQKDFNFYGIDSFEFKPLLICEIKDLEFFEQRTIEKFNVVSDGYNVSDCVEAPFRGREHSDETKRQIAEAGLGNQNAKGSKSRIGQVNSEEHRQKISKAQKGCKRDPELVKRSADKLRGRVGEQHHTEKTKTKLSEIQKVIQSKRVKQPAAGMHHSEETRLEMSRKRKGVGKSEEARANMIKSWEKRKATGLHTRRWYLFRGLEVPVELSTELDNQ